MTSSSLWYGENTSTRRNLLNCRPNWKPQGMPRRKRNEHDSRDRIRLAVQCVGADWTVRNFGGCTLAIHRESQGKVSTLLLSRDIRPLSGCACLQHALANSSECGCKEIAAAGDTGDRTTGPSLLALERALRGGQGGHPGAWCKNCAPCH